MPQYKLSQQVRITTNMVINNSFIKGSKTKSVVEVLSILGPDQEKYEISDELVKFILGLMNDIEIKGKDAPLLLEAQIALNKPEKSEKPDKKDK